MVFGLVVMVVTVYITVKGISHPSTRLTVAIALLGSIGVPIGLGAISVAWRLARRPNSVELRAEAEAKRRAAAALDDAAAAETIKAEMEAYVALRARRLEIDRRREELEAAARAVVKLQQELADAETQVGIEVSELDPKTIDVLGELMEPRRKVQLPSFYVMGLPVGSMAEAAVEWALRTLERRRMRQLAQLAPDALATVDKKQHANAGG